MSKSITSVFICGVAACLMSGVAFAEPKAPAAPAAKAPTTWAPPAEISGKAAAEAPAAAPAATPATAGVAPAAAPAASKEDACAAEAKTKGLKGNKKWAYVAKCVGK